MIVGAAIDFPLSARLCDHEVQGSQLLATYVPGLRPNAHLRRIKLALPHVNAARWQGGKVHVSNEHAVLRRAVTNIVASHPLNANLDIVAHHKRRRAWPSDVEQCDVFACAWIAQRDS